MVHLLAARTSIPPDVPTLAEALLAPLLPDLFACDAFIVTVVPLSDILGDLNLGAAWIKALPGFGDATMSVPRK